MSIFCWSIRRRRLCSDSASCALTILRVGIFAIPTAAVFDLVLLLLVLLLLLPLLPAVAAPLSPSALFRCLPRLFIDAMREVDGVEDGVEDAVE